MNAQPQAQQAPAPVNQSGIAMGNMGPLTQQTQQPAPAPQGMQGLDPKLVAAMMAQYAKQKEAEMNARQMALQAPQPQGTVVDQLLAQQGQQPQAPAGIQQLMGAQRGNVAQAQGIDAAPTPQSFKEGGIVGYAGNEGSVVVGPEMFAGDAMRGISAKAKESENTDALSPFEAWLRSMSKGEHNVRGRNGKAAPAASKSGRPSERYGDAMAADAPTATPAGGGAWAGAKKTALTAPGDADIEAIFNTQLAAAQQHVAEAAASGDQKAIDRAAADLKELTAEMTRVSGGRTFDVNGRKEGPTQELPPTYNPAPQNQGSPGGITLALPQRPQPQAAPVEAFANKAMGRDPEAARNAEIARWRAEVGPMDTSANDELLRELRTRKNELAKRPEKGIAGLLDYAKNIAAASKPGNAWWQDMSQGAQHGEAIDEKRREQEMAAMREMLLAQQNGANAKRADRQAGYDVGLKAEDRISKRAETAAGIAGPMRNADRAAEASMYHADTAAAASRYSTDSHLKGVMEQVSMGLKSRAPDAIKHAMDNAQMLLKSYHEKLATYKDNFDVSNPKSAAGKDVAALRDKIDILGQTLINLDPVLKSAMPQMAAAPTTGKVLEAK